MNDLEQVLSRLREQDPDLLSLLTRLLLRGGYGPSLDNAVPIGTPLLSLAIPQAEWKGDRRPYDMERTVFTFNPSLFEATWVHLYLLVEWGTNRGSASDVFLSYLEHDNRGMPQGHIGVQWNSTDQCLSVRDSQPYFMSYWTCSATHMECTALVPVGEGGFSPYDQRYMLSIQGGSLVTFQICKAMPPMDG